MFRLFIILSLLSGVATAADSDPCEQIQTLADEQKCQTAIEEIKRQIQHQKLKNQLRTLKEDTYTDSQNPSNPNAPTLPDIFSSLPDPNSRSGSEEKIELLGVKGEGGSAMAEIAFGDHKVILRPGDSFHGWRLVFVRYDEIALKKNDDIRRLRFSW